MHKDIQGDCHNVISLLILTNECCSNIYWRMPQTVSCLLFCLSSKSWRVASKRFLCIKSECKGLHMSKQETQNWKTRTKKWPTRLWGLKMLIDDSQIHKNGIGISKQGTFALKKVWKRRRFTRKLKMMYSMFEPCQLKSTCIASQVTYYHVT